MSVYVTAWVWQQIIGSPEAKLVLLKLADQANDEGECWPSRRTIASATEQSMSTVKRSIHYLTEQGFLSVEQRDRPNGSQTSNIYRFPRYVTGGSVGPPGGSVGPPGGFSQGEGVGSDRPPQNHSLEPSLNQEHARARIYTEAELANEQRLIAEAGELLEPLPDPGSREDNIAALAKLRSELGL